MTFRLDAMLRFAFAHFCRTFHRKRRRFVVQLNVVAGRQSVFCLKRLLTTATSAGEECEVSFRAAVTLPTLALVRERTGDELFAPHEQLPCCVEHVEIVGGIVGPSR